jgi:hypothetical protein
MSDNLVELINEAIEMADELDLNFDFVYTKEVVGFNFRKDYIATTHRFTNEEIDNCPEVSWLKAVLKERVYVMLDNMPRK